MENVISNVIEFADADVRRTLGIFRPVTCNFELKFIPREEFVYYRADKKLVYYELVKYGYFYYEVITGIIPHETEEHTWILEPNAHIRGVVWTDDHSNLYDRDWGEFPDEITLAGVPEFRP
jgi:hypothetical protein